jgi:hypothetical protein
MANLWVLWSAKDSTPKSGCGVLLPKWGQPKARMKGRLLITAAC